MTHYFTFRCLLFAFLILFFSACEKTIVEKADSQGTVYSIQGNAQKGPFVVGSDVTISELDSNLIPTGRVYFATILDDEGNFNLPGITLVSPYIQIKVHGAYFSEVLGAILPGITLYSIGDIRKDNSINVNIMTHLAKERIAYLVREESKSFEDAKTQALEELLRVFSLESFDIPSSEDLDILDESEGNAILLAISSIIELSESGFETRLALITNFQNDFLDGQLNSVVIQNKLLTAAFLLHQYDIQQNLEARFPDKSIPDLWPYVNHFIETSNYTNYYAGIFPEPTDGKINLLNLPTGSVLDPGQSYVIAIAFQEGLYVSLLMGMSGVFKTLSGEFSLNHPSAVLNEQRMTCNQGGIIDESCISSVSYKTEYISSPPAYLEIPVTISGNGESLNLAIATFIEGHYFSDSWSFSW
jgi:hypothetical protein